MDSWAGVLSDIWLFKVTWCAKWRGREIPPHWKNSHAYLSVALLALLPICHCYASFSEDRVILFTTDCPASTLLNWQSHTGFAALSPLQIRLTTQRGKWLTFQKRVMVHWLPGSYFVQSFCSMGELQVYFSFHRQYFNISVLYTRNGMRQLWFYLLRSIIHAN